ncbi:sulfatase-like hydrolase/transferase [Flammeovirga agarivorans]|uniref:Sulfatase-like hydrolase/transferase n=1 Tax=Flammeovirga agarivorans TaxID=2726742 RepID=A0A7X8XY32_9BACT|nr:sulfatase-like hydrolase/transferase [Flammeovirga agarivorans]NLR93723.1 sulfatase-like hydrolase/transferase [Flammeovirga agarivorans]
MKSLLLPRFLLKVLLCLLAGKSIAQTKPNIVVILVDDAGNKDWGFQGSTVAISPNIDQLAAEGTIFSQGYVTNSVCAPSRAGMLTGQYQNKIGFEYNIVTYSNSPDHTSHDVGIDPNVPTMGDYLKDLGYTTSLFGKWHVGEEEHHRPNARGFDYFYGLLSGSRNYNKVETAFNKKLRKNGVEVEPTDNNFYLTDLLTDDALAFMTSEIDAGNPFLAFMSYTAPHGPFQAKPEDKALFDANTSLSSDQKNYYGMIKNVDDNVKRIIDLLKEKQQYENTLFVFLSDNGGVGLTDNGVLKGNKSSQYEGGLRVPFFATWNTKIPSNTTYDEQVISLDLTTTFIKAAGGNLSDSRYAELDGKDLVQASNQVNTPLHSILYWRKLDRWGIASDGVNKLLFEATDPTNNLYDTVLYNLDSDISETTNVYSTASQNVSDLVIAYNNWNNTLDLPSWYGATILKNVCPTANNAKNCQVIVDRYAAFKEATKLEQKQVQTLSAEEYALSVISTSNIEFTDPIKNANVITYTITSLPNNGTVLRDGEELLIGHKFTQRQVNDGEIAYQSTSAVGTNDQLTLSVNDGSGGEEITDVILPITTTQRTTGTNYYVSSSNGNDTNSGTSMDSPIASIAKLNTIALQPGDWVHFKRGDTFIGQLDCNYSGIENASIIYKDYGNGALPILSGSTGNDGVPDPLTTILIVDQSFLEFKNLHIRNERFDAMEGVDNDKAFGILNYTEQLGEHKAGVNGKLPTGYSNKEFEKAIEETDTLSFNEHLYFSNLYFDKVYSLGLDGIPFNSVRSTAIYLEESFAKDIIIEDSYFTDLQRTGIWVRRWSTDIIIRNNQFVDIGGSGAILSVSNRILYENNYMQFCGANSDSRMAKRGSGMWTFGCDGVVAQFNISKHARGDGDSSGMHVDYGNKNILYQYNYSEDAAGGFCETLGDNDNVIWRYNISVNDADTDRGGKNLLLWISKFSSNNKKSRDVHIYNNTIYGGRDYDNQITNAKVLFEVEEFNFINNIIFLESDSKLGIGSGFYKNSATTTNFKKNIFFGGEFNSSLKNLDATRIEQNPEFIGEGTHNELGYQLKEGSPALKSGESFQEPTFPYAGQGVFKDVSSAAEKDYYGNPVDLSIETNIGAYNGSGVPLSQKTTVYEAEDAVISGGNSVSCSTASGGQIVEAENGTVTFTVNVDETKEYILKVYYMNPDIEPIQLSINNSPAEEVLLQFTNGWCTQGGVAGNYQFVKPLTSGANTISISNITLDKIEIVSFEEGEVPPPPTPQPGPTYEAELATLTGTAVITTCGNASEGEMVKGLTGGTSNALIFEGVNVDIATTYQLTVSYYATSEATLNYQIDEAEVQTLTLPATGQWCYQGGSPGDYTFDITLDGGDHTIKFFDSPIIDKIHIELPSSGGAWEAENAVLSGTALVYNCATSSGGKSVKGLTGGIANAVSFNDVEIFNDGEYELIITYMTSTNVTAVIEVNGVDQTISLPSTGKWCYQGGSSADNKIIVDLNQGLNSIKFYDSPQIDKIEIGELQQTTGSRKNNNQILLEDQLKVYPNPIQKGNNFLIDLGGVSPNLSIKLYDLMGQLIVHQMGSNVERIILPTNELSSGVYLLLIENDFYTKEQKVIIK